MSRWKAFSFYMPNADPGIVRLQKKVFDCLDEPLEQIRDTCSHGQFLTSTIRKQVDDLDAVVFFDLDCIPLKPGFVARAVRIAVDHGMIIGCAQQANHIEIGKILMRRKSWPAIFRKIDNARIRLSKTFGIDPYFFYQFKDPLIYAGPCFLVVPSKIYNFVGRPTLDVTARADAAGELTIACHEHGVKVKCLRPTYCHVPKYKLGNVKRYGLGTVYGNSIFHAFETTYLTNNRSASLFRQYSRDVMLRMQHRSGQ